MVTIMFNPAGTMSSLLWTKCKEQNMALNETRIIVFIDDLILTVIAYAFFTAYLYDIVYIYLI